MGKNNLIFFHMKSSLLEFMAKHQKQNGALSGRKLLKVAETLNPNDLNIYIREELLSSIEAF